MGDAALAVDVPEADGFDQGPHLNAMRIYRGHSLRGIAAVLVEASLFWTVVGVARPQDEDFTLGKGTLGTAPRRTIVSLQTSKW